jgi:hypothetical protein
LNTAFFGTGVDVKAADGSFTGDTSRMPNETSRAFAGLFGSPEQLAPLGRIVGASLSGLAAGVTTAVMKGGKYSVTQVAADAFGNALGSVTGEDLAATLYGERRLAEAQRQADLYGSHPVDTSSMGQVRIDGRTLSEDEQYRRGMNNPLNLSATATEGTSSAANANRPQPIYPETIEVVSPHAPTFKDRTHKVKEGETVEKISREYYREKWLAGIQVLIEMNDIPLNKLGSPLINPKEEMDIPDLARWDSDTLAKGAKAGGNLVANNQRGIDAEANRLEKAQKLQAADWQKKYNDQVNQNELNRANNYVPAPTSNTNPPAVDYSNAPSYDIMSGLEIGGSGLDTPLHAPTAAEYKAFAIKTVKSLVGADGEGGIIVKTAKGLGASGMGVLDWLNYGNYVDLQSKGIMPADVPYEPISSLGKSFQADPAETTKQLLGANFWRNIAQGNNVDAMASAAEFGIMTFGAPLVLGKVASSGRVTVGPGASTLDALYGTLKEPSLIKNFETTGYDSLDGTFGGGVVVNPGLKIWQPGEQIILDQSKNHIFSINADGLVVTGSETYVGRGPNIHDPKATIDYNLGHPTLNNGGPARISGELKFENGEWLINGDSGRYTKPYSERTSLQLQSAADLIRSQGLPVVIKPKYVPNPKLFIE